MRHQYPDNDSIEAWVEMQIEDGNDDDVKTEMRERLFASVSETPRDTAERNLSDSCSELNQPEYDIYMDDYNTVVVDTPEFTGSHYVADDGIVDELGFYIHDSTDFEMEITCPTDIYELEECARDAHDSEPPSNAALSPSERNPNLGGRL